MQKTQKNQMTPPWLENSVGQQKVWRHGETKTNKAPKVIAQNHTNPSGTFQNKNSWAITTKTEGSPQTTYHGNNNNNNIDICLFIYLLFWLLNKPSLFRALHTSPLWRSAPRTVMTMSMMHDTQQHRTYNHSVETWDTKVPRRSSKHCTATVQTTAKSFIQCAQLHNMLPCP